MTDKTSVIFNNPMPKKVIKGAEKSKKKYIKKYGDDSCADYKISFKDIPTLDFINTSNIVFGEDNQKFEDNALIVGNIRMGHAQYNPGNDIVCASVSTITETFIRLLSLKGCLDSNLIKESGVVTLLGETDESIYSYLEFVTTGYSGLANSYPDNVRLEVIDERKD